MDLWRLNGSDKSSKMDGPKRLAFTTLDPVTKKTEKEKKVEKTLRLEVDLLDSTDTTYPEFSYTDLVKSATVSHSMSEMFILHVTPAHA